MRDAVSKLGEMGEMVPNVDARQIKKEEDGNATMEKGLGDGMQGVPRDANDLREKGLREIRARKGFREIRAANVLLSPGPNGTPKAKC